MTREEKISAVVNDANLALKKLNAPTFNEVYARMLICDAMLEARVPGYSETRCAKTVNEIIKGLGSPK